MIKLERIIPEKIVNKTRGQVKAVINVEDILKEHEELRPKSRANIGPSGMKLAKIIGELAAKKVDEILLEADK